MSEFVPNTGYSRPIGGLTETGAITKLRQDARIIGQPQGDKSDPERKNWVVRIKDDNIKIYESMQEATKDGARGPAQSPVHGPVHGLNRGQAQIPFRVIHPSPTFIDDKRITSPIFHQDDVDRIKVTEENLAASQASFSEFDIPLSVDTLQHVKDRWVILKELAHQKVVLAEQELKLARFDEMKIIQEQQAKLEEKLKILRTTHV